MSLASYNVWLAGRASTPALFDEYTRFTDEYVASVHPGGIVDPGLSVISYRESVDLAYGEGTSDYLGGIMSGVSDWDMGVDSSLSSLKWIIVGVAVIAGIMLLKPILR